MIKSIIFDWGGVLSNSNHERAMQRLKDLGLKDAEQYFVEGKNWQSIFGDIESGSITPDEFLLEFSAMCGRTVTFDEVAYAWWGFYDGIQEGVLPALEKWAGKYRLYVLTNNNPFMMSYINSPKFVPKDKPFSSYFKHIYASCDLHLAKPDTAIYSRVLDEINLQADEVIFVDDRQQNLDGAAKVGMHTFLADNTTKWVDTLDFELEKW